MHCTFCPGNQSTFHLSKIVNGKSVEVHVCEKCIPQLANQDILDFDVWDAVSKLAKKKGKPDPCKIMEDEASEISAKSLLMPMQSSVKETPHQCPHCGFSHEDLRKTGRLGCCECYSIFSDMLEDVFNDCQKGDRHTGKVPKAFHSLHRKRLEQQLETAISEERFEDAAILRDKLNQSSDE